MTDLPSSNLFTTVTTTNGVAKVAQDDLLEFVRESVGGAAIAELTLDVSGQITPTSGLHTVDTFADASEDDLTNILTTNLAAGRLLLIKPASDARTVVVKHQAGGAGQISLSDGNDYFLNTDKKWLLAFRDGSDWTEIARFNERGEFVGNQTIRSTDDSALAVPLINLRRSSASPAIDDDLGAIFFYGDDSLGNQSLYGSIRYRILDPTSGSEDGEFRVRPTINNSSFSVIRAHNGVLIGDPTGGYQGDPGSINAESYWQNGIRLRPAIYEAQTATTSGTSVTLTTGIPSNATEVEVFLNGVSTNTSSQPPIIQVGGTSFESSGYTSNTASLTTGVNVDLDTDGFYCARPASFQLGEALRGIVRITRWDRSEDYWEATGIVRTHNSAETYVVSGGIFMSTGDLARVQLTTPGGTATFDAGEARVRYR